MEITDEELREALKKVRLWLRPETPHGGLAHTAYQGYILHPEDAANDILTIVQHMRV